MGRRRGLTLWTACASLCAAAVDGERAGATALRAAAAGCQRVGGTALWAAARSAAAADFERVGTVGRTTFWASRSRSAGRRSSHPLHALWRGEVAGSVQKRRLERRGGEGGKDADRGEGGTGADEEAGRAESRRGEREKGDMEETRRVGTGGGVSGGKEETGRMNTAVWGEYEEA